MAKIWIGAWDSSKNGVGFYASSTSEGIYKQVAPRCREEYHEWDNDGYMKAAKLKGTDEEAVDKYFENFEDEFFYIDEIEIVD